MSEKILYEHQLLQITDETICIEGKKISYSEIDSVEIYQGRPFMIHGIMGAVLLIPYGLTLLYLSRILSSLGIIPILLLIPELLMMTLGFGIKTQYLYVQVNGEKTPLLNHKDSKQLEELETIIDRQIQNTRA